MTMQMQAELDAALQRARVAHAAAAPAACDAALAEAATAGRVLAVALLAPRGARVEWGDPARRLEVADARAAPALLLHAFGAAVLVADRRALRAMLVPGVFAAAEASGEASGVNPGHARCWTELGERFAGAVLGEPALADALRRCDAAIAQARATALDPDAGPALLRPLAAVLEALAGGDTAATRAALIDAFERHRAFYADPARRGLTLGAAAWELSACAALARHRLGVDPACLAGMASFVERVAPAPGCTLRLVLPERSLPDARRAGWQADAFDVPRPTRTVHDVAGGLDIAASGRFGIDAWQAHVVLDADAPDLPATVLLAASDFLAAQVDDAPPENVAERTWQRGLLEEAIAALDAVLDGPEPLDRDRLQARRAVYAELLAAYDRAAPPKAAARAAPPEPGVAATSTHPGHATTASQPGVPATLCDADADATAPPQADAREMALASAAIVRAQVLPLLDALAQDATGAVARSLRPRPGDAALAFTPDRADAFDRASRRLWADGPRLPRAAPGSRVVCHVAPAGMLAHDNALSRHFPGGYRALAGALQPQRVWVAWKVLPPGAAAGMAYDGLVWLDDHWAWFPKPYRWLGADRE